MELTPREKWPHWLKAAHTEDARVTVDDSGRVTWLGGIWHDGDWLGGTWCGGVWRGGVWNDGIWRGGVWNDGIWRDGEWRGGVWNDGIWRGGEWRGGTTPPNERQAATPPPHASMPELPPHRVALDSPKGRWFCPDEGHRIAGTSSSPDPMRETYQHRDLYVTRAGGYVEKQWSDAPSAPVRHSMLTLEEAAQWVACHCQSGGHAALDEIAAQAEASPARDAARALQEAFRKLEV